jgi:formylglycine-generating enzyme required for sulfatase activity
LSGNIIQWTEDWYNNEMPPFELKEKYPVLGEDGGGQKYRAARGSAWWDCDADLIQSAAVRRYPPDYRSDYVGFRLIMDFEPGPP